MNLASYFIHMNVHRKIEITNIEWKVKFESVLFRRTTFYIFPLLCLYNHPRHYVLQQLVILYYSK